MFLICCLITQIYLLFPKSYIFFARLNSIRTGLPFNTSRLLPVSGEAKILPFDENAVLYQQFNLQTLPVLMPTNAGTRFLSFHPLWAAEGAKVFLAAQGSVAACEQPGQAGQMVARELTSLCTVSCWLVMSLLVTVLQIKSVISI